MPLDIKYIHQARARSWVPSQLARADISLKAQNFKDEYFIINCKNHKQSRKFSNICSFKKNESGRPIGRIAANSTWIPVKPTSYELYWENV